MEPAFKPRWDELDERILQLLRTNGKMPLADIAMATGIAMSTVSNRIKRLVEAGVLQGYRVVVDPRFSVAGVEAIVTITAPSPNGLQLVLQELEATGVLISEVYRTLGSAEYVCRVVAPTVESLDRAVALADRHEGSTVNVFILAESMGPGLSSGKGGPAPAEPGPARTTRALAPGSRLYFVSLTEIDPDRISPERIVQTLAQAGFTTLVVDAVNPWGAYYGSRRVPLSPHCHGQDLLAAFCEAAMKQKVEILAAVECRALPPFLAAEHPRWLQRQASGEALIAYGPFYRGCFRNGWQEWLRSVAKELLEKYPLGGLVALNPEYDPASCYCETCQNGFRAQKGVHLPREGEAADHPTWWRWLKWKVESVNQFVESLADLVHQATPAGRLLVMSDQALAERPQTYGVALADLATRCDGVISAGEPGKRLAAPLLDVLDRWDRGAAQAPVIGTFAASLSASYAPWTYYPVAPGRLELGVELLAAAGQNIACLDLGKLDELQFPARQAGPGEEPARGGRAGDLLPVAREPLWHYTALLYSEQDWCSPQGRAAEPSHARCFSGLYRALTGANIPFRVISLEHAASDPVLQKTLESFHTVILPALNQLPTSFVRWLRRYAERGGGVLVTYPGVLADRQSEAAPLLLDLLGLSRVDQPQTAEAAYFWLQPQGLSGVAGAAAATGAAATAAVAAAPDGTAGGFAATGSAGTADGPDLHGLPGVLPAYSRWLPVDPGRARVCGHILAQESAWGGVSRTGYPALVAHELGSGANSGRTLLFTYPLGALYGSFPDPTLETLLVRSVAWAARRPSPLMVSGERPLVVRVTAAPDSRQVYAHVTDAETVFTTRPWLEPPPLPSGFIDLELDRPPQEGVWLPSGEKASWSKVGPVSAGPDRYRFPLPKSRGRALLVLTLS
ncbi:MAG TPA: AsnC family transcriptional regulator [Firmicutes bacterium]|nr:AsnC family transcriptional regulator [Bacillota bacterium]